MQILCFGLSKRVAPETLTTLLKTLYPSLAFCHLDHYLESSYSEPSDDNCLFNFIDYASDDFPQGIDVYLPDSCVNNETELFVGRAISRAIGCQVLASADFYDKDKYPHEWFIIENDRLYLAFEREVDERFSYPIFETINLDITKGQGKC